MHVAFFNRSFHPEETATGRLLTDLCEDLVRDHGCQVSVVTGYPLAPDGSTRARVPAREQYRGVRVYRARGTRLSRRRFVGRATNYVTYFLSACVTGLRIERPDVVVALTDPPIIGLAAWIAGRRFRAPLVMAFKDVFPEVTVLLRDFQSPAVNALLQAVNRFLVRRAACNVALGETMRRRLIEGKGAPAERTIVIEDWADTTAIVPSPRRNAFAEAHDLVDSFVVMHSGNLGLSQGLETLLEAAALLRDLPDMRMVFIGDGVARAELQAQARARSLTHVMFLPFTPRERLTESFATADVFVVSLRRGLAGHIVPSKLYGILAAGRPFVASVDADSEVAGIARRHDCGLVVEPGSAAALADAIRRLHGNAALRAAMGQRARAASLRFDRRRQVARYMKVFCDVRSAGHGVGEAAV